MEQCTTPAVYLGIDVHKRTYMVTAVREGELIKTSRINACPVELISYCKKFFPNAPIRSCYEAGFSGYQLHRTLLDANIQNIVVHPASIELEARNRVKNDKRDSRKMAIQLAQGRLKGINIPTPEQEDLRAVSRLRDTLIKERTRTGLRIKSLLYTQGAIAWDAKIRISEKWLKGLLELEFSPGIRYVLETHIKIWLQISESIKETGSKLERQTELEEIFTSIPGIGPTAARTLINELGDLSQFRNEKALYSFVGLTPSEHCSGEHRWQGHITRQGRPSLRKVLVQCAWVSIKYDYSLGENYERLSNRIGSRKAIVAIARKLLGRLLSCVKGKRKYECVSKNGEAIVCEFEDKEEVVCKKLQETSLLASAQPSRGGG